MGGSTISAAAAAALRRCLCRAGGAASQLGRQPRGGFLQPVLRHSWCGSWFSRGVTCCAGGARGKACVAWHAAATHTHHSLPFLAKTCQKHVPRQCNATVQRRTLLDGLVCGIKGRIHIAHVRFPHERDELSHIRLRELRCECSARRHARTHTHTTATNPGGT